VTAEPSIFQEKEISADPEFKEVKNTFVTWEEGNGGKSCSKHYLIYRQVWVCKCLAV